jgi:hypothetical protein
MKMNKLPTAFFVEYPYKIEDLMRPHFSEWRKPYIVKKEIKLGKMDYENFTTDLCVDRWFIEKYTHLCQIDEEGVWRCILVRQKGKPDGILVMSEGRVFPKWAAYLPCEVTDNE